MKSLCLPGWTFDRVPGPVPTPMVRRHPPGAAQSDLMRRVATREKNSRSNRLVKTKGLIHCKSVAEADKNGKENCFNIKWQVQIWFTTKNNGTCLQRLWEEQRPVYGPHFKEVAPPQTAAPLASKLA